MNLESSIRDFFAILRQSKSIALGTLLFVAYLVVFAWLVTKVKFFTNSGLSNSQLIIFFLLKVIAGIIYGWIGVKYGETAKMVDTWSYHYQALSQYKLLKANPWEFFSEIFHSPYANGYGGFLSENSWWNDLKGTTFIKLIAIFDVFSFGHYYINVVIFSFLSLFGPIALYRVMKDVLPAKKIVVLLATFLIPSFLYWTSGLHKDGLIFVGFAIIVYNMHFGFLQHRFSVKKILFIAFGLLLVLFLRNFYIIPLIPALLAWILSQRSKSKPILVYSILYIAFIVLFFTAKYISPKLDFPAAVSEKQQRFLLLEGGSSIHVNSLEPTFTSFVINAPQAGALTILRPYPTDVKHLLSLAASIEINLLLLLFLIFLFWRRNGTSLSPFLLFCIFFSFSNLIMIGYTQNNLGAVVRYRSMFLPFLIVPVVAMINWQRIGAVFLGDIIKNKNL